MLSGLREPGGTLKDILIRFFIGGAVVSAFAVIGDLFKPKTFAGLFGAAPSVALATLGLTVISHGKLYAAIESRSMLLGSIALFFYLYIITQVLVRTKINVAAVTVAGTVLWLGVALGLWILAKGS